MVATEKYGLETTLGVLAGGLSLACRYIKRI
jgi:hypothetical protein